MPELSDALRAQMVRKVAVNLANVAKLPAWMEIPALGQDLTPVAELAVDALIKAGFLPSSRVLCVFPGCDLPPLPDSLRCDRHKNCRVSSTGSFVDSPQRHDRGHG